MSVPPPGSFDRDPEGPVDREWNAAGWLIVVGLVLVLGGVAWYVSMEPSIFTGKEPDRGPAVLVGVAGGLAFVAGVALYRRD